MDALESDVSTLKKELRDFRAEVREQFADVRQQFAEMGMLHRRHGIELRAIDQVLVSLLQDGDKTRAEISGVRSDVRGLREEMNARFDEVLKRLPPAPGSSR